MTTYASPVRVRMAPSPTGFFHVGSARTALFSFLFARHCGGTFVLRIEDTDAARNDPAYEAIIYEALNWLGLNADESPQVGGTYGPYRQSERFSIYAEYAQRLVAAGAAYLAYESAEELAAMKADLQARKLPPRYDGAHRNLSAEQRAAYEAQGRKPVIRLRVPEGVTAWDDLVYGTVSWKNTEMDDFVIAKSDGAPTYNLACVVDDALMRISHVIRGEDGLSNTPRQLRLYAALGLEPPSFAHLPFLLGRDRSKLSKRHGAVNLMDYAAQDILPEAMLNYLCLLGWNPGQGETQEIFSLTELTERFTLGGVNKSGAIFDVEKLQWMNTQYLKALPIEAFIERARPHLKNGNSLDAGDPYTRQALALARERIHALSDIGPAATYFFTDEFETDPSGAAKHLNDTAYLRIEMLAGRLADLTEWTHDAIEATVRALAEELGAKPAELIHPARLLVSGRTVGPSLFELLEALGRDRVLRRLRRNSLS